ncbi:MAG: class I mannose-6-phosphate isomerase [Synergistaceae bacterium]|nr:class I mannose-6-phosphate isomerase [Synergistaceae bacterium]
MLSFRLRPVFKDYLWGGTRLITDWGKTPDSPTLAESWELASHKDGDNLILDGELVGLTLSEAAKKYPAVVSPSFSGDDTFPLMVKLIDSQQPLSIQVHPFNDYARRVEHSRGKTECWYILNHDEGAYIYLGFSRNVSRRDFEQAITDGTVTGLLRKVYVKDGDLYFIPAGTIHAIGPGITLAEIQENSNITYRVYDYGRVGADGKPRELHIAKALDVTNTFPLSITPPGRAGNVLVSCSKFHVEKAFAPFTGRASGSFRFLLCLDGEGRFSCGSFECEMVKGSNVYVPADCEEMFTLCGKSVMLAVSLNQVKGQTS